MRSKELYLADMIGAADAIAEYIRGISWEEFSKKRMVRTAVIHELQTIGEAVSKISKLLKAHHPDIKTYNSLFP